MMQSKASRRLRRSRAALAMLLLSLGACTKPDQPVVTPIQMPGYTRTWVVFFEWNRTELSDRGRAIVGEFASLIASISARCVILNGNADRSGPSDYNHSLSERRAANVAAELVRAGVDRSIISISAFGETRPLIPTDDGVREIQNRYVLMDYRCLAPAPDR